MKTIKSSKDIDLIFKNGEKINFPFLNLILYKTNSIKGNVAFIAGKKNGNAVWRNKSKRILREIYRQIKINEEYKLLLIANKKINDYKFDEMVKDIEERTKKYN